MSRRRFLLALGLVGVITAIAYGIVRFPSYRFVTSFDRAVLLIKNTGDINHTSIAIRAAKLCRTQHDRTVVERRCLESLSEKHGHGMARYVAAYVLIEGCSEVSEETIQHLMRLLDDREFTPTDHENLQFLLDCLIRKKSGLSPPREYGTAWPKD
ncbi:MAG: hypothetical protein JNM43_18780 [Planctomycetaceae bacterium]|nr:hypothetical protein [Planctomycetaceae bacterium]